MIKIANNAGFCNGVQKAFDLAIKLGEQYDKVYTLGELVHNENVTKFLQSKRVFCLKDNEFDKLKSGDVALIRAHGLDREIEQKLKDKGVIIYDATCIVVKKNQQLISQREKANDKIIIVGDPNHDEVKGYLSYAGVNCQVVSDADHIQLTNQPTSILFQTTILKEKFESIELELKNLKNYDANLVGIFNTCCYNTTIRQREARMLAKESDIVIVVGSCNSANTKRLYEVSKEINESTYFVSNIEDLKSIKESKQRKVISIVAGASTPPWLIQEVTQLMSEETKVVVEEQKEANLQAAEPVTMEDLLKSEKSGYVEYRQGARVRCKVFSANENGILVAIGGKKDGFIDKEDATCDGNYVPANYKKDDIFFAIIKSVEKDYVKLSKKEIDAKEAANAEAEKALAAGEFELKMTEVVKGGLRAKLGRYTIFVPASQIKIGFVNDLEQYKDKTLRLVLMPPKDEAPVEGEDADKAKKVSRYLFASQRIILEREKQAKEDAFWNNIHVNDIVTGKVKRFTQFGAFISVKGADGTPHDCLAHVSELSWTKVNDPSKVLKIGDVCDFVVLKLDRETGKVSLGYKQLQKKPYEIAAEKYPIGTVVKGTVHSVHPYGAFILIEDGIDGLVHVSQISHNWIKDANEALKVGEEVEAKIIGFDDNRITLSIKELLPAPEVAEAAEEATEEEKTAKRSSRAKKFEKAAEGGEAAPKKERKSKKAADEEATEYISGSSNASLGDLLKGLKFDLEAEEEKPAKKTTKKKKADDAE